MARIVLGLQGTVDYEVAWDSGVLEGLAAEHGIRAEELRTDAPVDDERSLVVALLGFLRAGTGGERFVSSSDIVERFAARFRTEVTLGGTSVRAALVLRALGIPSVLHLVSVDDTVRRLLPADCDYVSSATEDTLDPHLIVQYRVGDTVRVGRTDIVADGANRVIFANDPPAARLRLSPELGDRVARADVVLVSGFNTIQDPGVLEERLAEIRAVIARAPAGATVLYEDAGFHDQRFAPRVADALAPAVDVFSLNEDELQARLGRTVELTDPAAVAEALRQLHGRLAHPTVLVHTRAWSALFGPRAAELAPAADAGNVVAATRHLVGDALTAADVAQVAATPRATPAVAFARALDELTGAHGHCLPAVDVRPAAPTTIGLGDTFVGGLIARLAGRDPAAAGPVVAHAGGRA